MSYSLPELSAEKLKEFFDAALMEASIESDGDLRVDTPLKVFVTAQPDKGLLRCVTLFGVNAELEKVIDFCNRFNRGLILCRCFVADKRDSDGDWCVYFDYDRFMLPDEKIAPKTIVLLVRRFTEIVNGGIQRFDEDGLFS